MTIARHFVDCLALASARSAVIIWCAEWASVSLPGAAFSLQAFAIVPVS